MANPRPRGCQIHFDVCCGYDAARKALDDGRHGNAITAVKGPMQHGLIHLCRRLRMAALTRYDDPKNGVKRMNETSGQSAEHWKRRFVRRVFRLRVSRLRVCCLAFALLPSCLIVSGQNVEHTHKLQAMASGNQHEAERYFRLAAAGSAAELSSQQKNADLLQAKSLVELAEYARAEMTLRHALQGQPSSAQMLYLLAHVQQLRNEPPRLPGYTHGCRPDSATVWRTGSHCRARLCAAERIWSGTAVECACCDDGSAKR